MKVESEVSGALVVVTLDGPSANILRPPAFDEPTQRIGELLAEPELKGLILRGAGRHFCAGADRDALARMLADDEDGLTQELDAGKALVAELTWATIPTVAMIRGSCLGGGLEIALACHFRVASENAMLGFPESTLGLIPGLGGTIMAPEVLSRRVAMDLLLSGRTVSGSEALELGLVDLAVPTRKLEESTRGFLESLVGRRSPQVVRAVLTSIHNARRLPRDEALRAEGELFLEVARAKSHDGSAGEERS